MQVFKELDHDYLKKYASRWRKKYSCVPIKQIVLHEYYPEPESELEIKSRDNLKAKNSNSKEPRYVVVFEVFGLDLDYYIEGWRTYMEGVLRYVKGRRCCIQGMKVYDLPWRDFIYKMDNISIATIPEISYFINNFNGFDDVYKQSARDDCYKDWRFEAYPPEVPLPHYVDKKVSMVLWDKKKSIDEKTEQIKISNKIETNDGGKRRIAIQESKMWAVYFDGNHEHLNDLICIRYI